MKSFAAVLFVAIATLVLFHAREAGTKNPVSFMADYPAELSAFADKLTARGYLESSERAVLQRPARDCRRREVEIRFGAPAWS